MYQSLSENVYVHSAQPTPFLMLNHLLRFGWRLRGKYFVPGSCSGIRIRHTDSFILLYYLYLEPVCEKIFAGFSFPTEEEDSPGVPLLSHSYVWRQRKKRTRARGVSSRGGKLTRNLAYVGTVSASQQSIVSPMCKFLYYYLTVISPVLWSWSRNLLFFYALIVL